MSLKFCIPDTLADWPLPRQINPHYEQVRKESSAWFNSFNAFQPEAQRAFDLCDFSLLSSLAYPTLSKPHLRIGCDLMNLFFVFDAYTDEEDEKIVQTLAEIVMDAIRNPQRPRPIGENVLGEISRQFWERAVKASSLTFQRRFIEVFGTFTLSVAQQTEDRIHKRLRCIDCYMSLRRKTIGADPSYTMIEINMDLPDEVFCHPIIRELSNITTDMIVIGNDICSFKKEYIAGDDLHNIVFVVMNELDTDIAGAMSWVEEFHRELVSRFLDCWTNLKLPSWGPDIDRDIQDYVRGLANWVRANDAWHFESGRYFGSEGKSIQQHRIVAILGTIT